MNYETVKLDTTKTFFHEQQQMMYHIDAYGTIFTCEYSDQPQYYEECLPLTYKMFKSFDRNFVNALNQWVKIFGVLDCVNFNGWIFEFNTYNDYNYRHFENKTLCEHVVLLGDLLEYIQRYNEEI